MNATISTKMQLWETGIPAGAHWSGVLQRGQELRIVDCEGGANVSTLLFSADDPLERYNMPDTLKAQHTAYLTKGYVCYSDMGRILCSITEDSCGWHDPLCGVSNVSAVAAKYGTARYQEHRNEYYKNGYDSLLNEVAKHGLGKRDIVATINFFSKVTVDEHGALHFVAGHSRKGNFVDLRFEMRTLLALTTCQHPLDPNPQYQPRPIQLIAWQSGASGRDDVCRRRCPENERGFINTELLYR